MPPNLYSSNNEFSGLAEVAEELNRPFRPDLKVARRDIRIDGLIVSSIVWDTPPPEVVFLHGGGQNAHTWDAVALALGRPAIAVDLPGHGHSSWRGDRDYGPDRNAQTVADVLDQLAPAAQVVVGMSLGGLTLIRLAAARPDLVARAIIVDITPRDEGASGHMTQAERGAAALILGPRRFATRQAMVDDAIRVSPRRSAASVERGVMHNSRQFPDGMWGWRYDEILRGRRSDGSTSATLWRDLDSMVMPTMLVIGEESHHVTDRQLSRFRGLKPDAQVRSVQGAGHAVQSDRPTELARLISQFGWSREPPPKAVRDSLQ